MKLRFNRHLVGLQSSVEAQLEQVARERRALGDRAPGGRGMEGKAGRWVSTCTMEYHGLCSGDEWPGDTVQTLAGGSRSSLSGPRDSVYIAAVCHAQ